ncbi:hypothetical protein [Longitalea luteola]|uniref:hypothetical protein n=1 Tax=Longitalea luteola TaxID=2812563 RepID=UPI001A96CAD7|nr:hypothetical protein [Longitalea luteola]
MVPGLRKAFNKSFTDQQYQAFLKDLHSKYPGAIEFRLCETPVFVDKQFTAQMIEACEHIIDVVTDPSFKQMTEASIPANERVPHENDRCAMFAFDFGICLNDQQQPEPRLIEMQGFPTLFGFQVFYPDLFRKYFLIPDNYSQFLNGHTRESYLKLLKEVILEDVPVENTILLEIKPHEQKTRIDFYNTQEYLGIQPVCITELIQEGKDLYYKRAGKKTAVKRIYNRVIFDELQARKNSLGNYVDITQDLNVQWVPHPNWFYRISKYTLPFLHHPYVPPTYFLHEIKQLPADLENYVLKPLFSFAGQGVVIDVTPADVEKIDDPYNWILQRKVQYADIIETPDIPAKAEIRIMYVWKKGWDRPQPVINLARLSKGKMIGVAYNKDKTWVGGSVCFMER